MKTSEKSTAKYDKSAADMQIGKKRTIAEAAINELKEVAARKILDFDKASTDRGAAVGTVVGRQCRASSCGCRRGDQGLAANGEGPIL